jgi:hypothetical protein
LGRRGGGGGGAGDRPVRCGDRLVQPGRARQ